MKNRYFYNKNTIIFNLKLKIFCIFPVKMFNFIFDAILICENKNVHEAERDCAYILFNAVATT